MIRNISLSLTDELLGFVKARTDKTGLYVTPSEYICDLIRRDMEAQATVAHITSGLDDLANGRFSEKSILDIAVED